MNKFNESEQSSNPTDVGNREKTKENSESELTKTGSERIAEKYTKPETEDQDILKFTVIFNKYNSVLDRKRRNDDEKRDNKYSMFFNKEVTIRRVLETPVPAVKLSETKKSGYVNPRRNQLVRTTQTKSKFHPNNFYSPEPEISEPGMMFCSPICPAVPNVCEMKAQQKVENLKKFVNKINSKMDDSLVELNVHPASVIRDLRSHSSLTNLSKNTKLNLNGGLKSKIPSLTALDASSAQQKNGFSKFGCCDHWDDLILMQSDVEKRLNLQISRSSNDNNRRSVLKFKKEDAASVSDSKLLCTDSESKKHIKKCDKKSRGDSGRKEGSCGNRKQVQWKTEVDVIYFATHMAANGDRTAEVIGRVMEPLREEWEQQRKGFYAKMVPSHMESHIKDRFISLLKI